MSVENQVLGFSVCTVAALVYPQSQVLFSPVELSNNRCVVADAVISNTTVNISARTPASVQNTAKVLFSN